MFGCFDVCINNVGIGEGKFFFNSEDWCRVIDFNFVVLIDGIVKVVNFYVFLEFLLFLCLYLMFLLFILREILFWLFLFRFK